MVRHWGKGSLRSLASFAAATVVGFGCQKRDPEPREPRQSIVVPSASSDESDADVPVQRADAAVDAAGSDKAGRGMACCVALQQTAASAPPPTNTYMMQAAAACKADVAEGKDEATIFATVVKMLKGAASPVACRQD